ARPLEEALVPGLRVGDVDDATHRVDGHVEECGADATERRRLRERARVEREHVLVGQAEADALAPVTRERVTPLPGALIELYNDPGLGRALAESVGRRAGHTARHDEALRVGALRGASEAVADRTLADRRRLVSGMEDRRVDGRAVRAGRERTRRVAEECHDRDR